MNGNKFWGSFQEMADDILNLHTQGSAALAARRELYEEFWPDLVRAHKRMQEMARHGTEWKLYYCLHVAEFIVCPLVEYFSDSDPDDLFQAIDKMFDRADLGFDQQRNIQDVQEQIRANAVRGGETTLAVVMDEAWQCRNELPRKSQATTAIPQQRDTVLAPSLSVIGTGN